MNYAKIPDETIKRLPMYLRVLSLLPNGSKKQEYISSRQIAEMLDANPHQIRKDLSYFGAFGTRGIGYEINSLKERIRNILKLNKSHPAVLVGAGKLGSAICTYPGFEMYNLNIEAVFDNSADKIGKDVGGITVENSAMLANITDRKIKLGILAVPAEAAQGIADELVGAGVKGILNLSPRYLKVPKEVKVIMMDIAMSMGTLPYYI